MKTAKMLCAAFVVMIGLAAAIPAHAADKLDLSVGLKTLPLLTSKLSGAVTMAVVFDPSNANSKSDADAIKAALDAGVDVPGGVKVTGILVPLSDVASKMSQAKLAFIARGACSDAVSTAVSANSILSMSTDIDCVKAGKSVIGVVSTPSVEIYYSKAAADAAKVSFSPAFSMLVKQV